MCDTFVALPNYTAAGELIFGKNSDREPNEAQAIVRFPARNCDESSLQCTYIEIPQVRRTHQVILSKPFQMWGAEMGANEHGVVIGNEAVFTKIKMPKVNAGLTGMDLVRLALERSTSADDALQTIIDLLEQHGQNACGGYRSKKFFYHNSFIVADASSAWVLETAGKHWAAEQVSDFRSISNGLTIETDYDRISEHAIAFAHGQGWHQRGEDFNFRRAYSDWFFTRAANCRRRQQHSNKLGRSVAGEFDFDDAQAILRSHESPDDRFVPSRSSSGSICMHASGITNPSQTTGSMIVQLAAGQSPCVWLTGTSMPCLSVYLPFWFGDVSEDHPLVPTIWNSPGAQPDESLWWQAERVHRWVCRDYRGRAGEVQQACRQLQKKFLEGARALAESKASQSQQREFSAQAISRTQQLWHELSKSIDRNPAATQGLFYRYFWHRTNRQVGWA